MEPALTGPWLGCMLPCPAGRLLVCGLLLDPGLVTCDPALLVVCSHRGSPTSASLVVGRSIRVPDVFALALSALSAWSNVGGHLCPSTGVGSTPALHLSSVCDSRSGPGVGRAIGGPRHGPGCSLLAEGTLVSGVLDFLLGPHGCLP